VVDLLAALLRRVVAETSPEDGTTKLITLTCPADWGPQRREVLRTAARAAGLPEVRLVDEPIAAATYCAEVLGTPIPVGSCLLVFDFGGGTLDVTVVRREPDGLRVLAVGGLDDLGGVDIDAALVGHLGQLVALRQPEAWRRVVDPQSTGEQRARRAFWTEVRAAKEMLSRAPSAPIQIPGTDDAIHLTREELERVAGPLIDRAVDETRRVLGRAGVGAPAGILLVGGSSRIPLVASRLHTRFGIAPTVPEQPELPVAYGGLLVAWPGQGGPGTPAAGPSGPVSVAPYQVAPVTGTGPGVYQSSGRSPVPAAPAGWAPESALPPPRPPAWAPAPGQQPGWAPASPAPGGAVAPAGWAPAPASPAPGGAVAPPGWAPAPASPAPTAAPPAGWAPPPSAPYTPAPPRRRSPTRTLVTLAIVLAVVVGLGWGGTKLFGAVKHGLTSLPNVGGNNGAGGQAGTGGPLQLSGSAIDLSGDGARAVAAGGNLVFYSVSGAGKTVVHAVDPIIGTERWKQDVTVDPAEASMHTVGDLLVLDAKESATDGGKDMRVVLQAINGHQLQKLEWSKRADVAYLGTDAIVATTWQPFQTMRVNLKTGQTTWKSTPLAANIAYHPIAPELTWAAGPANVPAPVKGFTESLGANPDRFVQLDADNNTVQVVNGAGKVTAHGTVPIRDELLTVVWTAFDGLVIGALSDEASPGRAALGAYRLDNLKQAWNPVGVGAGDEIKYVHPCGEHLVCATYNKKSDDTNAVIAVDTRTGQKVAWSTQPPYGDFSDDPYWSVYAQAMVYGDGGFPPQLGCSGTGLRVLNPATGASVRTLAEDQHGCGATLVAAAGRYLAVRTVHVSISTSSTAWQVSLVDLTTGKQSDALDTHNKELPVAVAVSGTTVAVLGGDRKLQIAIAAKLT